MGRIDVTVDKRVLSVGSRDFKKFVVDIIGDKGRWKLAKVLLERRCDGVDIEVRVGDVVVVAAFEALFNSLYLGCAAGFAVDAFLIHT